MAELWPGFSAGVPNPNFNPNTSFLPTSPSSASGAYVTYNGGQGGQGGTPIYGISTTMPTTSGGTTTIPITPGAANPTTSGSVYNPTTSSFTNPASGYSGAVANGSAVPTVPTNTQTTPVTPKVPEIPILPEVPKVQDLTKDSTLNTDAWNKINESPIPQIPAEYGQGSGMSQVDWALQHRKNIYDAYQKYGITPSAEEVNWQLAHSANIGAIDQSIADAVSSGRDTRGKMPQNITTAPKQNTTPGLPAVPNTLESDYAKNLVPSSDEVTTQNMLDNIIASKELGIQAVSEQPIAMGFITGQQSAIEKRASAQSIPLSQKLARLQAQRVAALDASRFALERSDKQTASAKEEARYQQERTDKLAQRKVKFETFNGQNWQLTYDSNGNLIDQKPMGSAYKASSGGGGSTPSTKLTDSNGEPITNPSLAEGKLTSQEEKTAYNNLVRATAILSGKVNNGEYTIDQAVDEIFYQKIKGSITYGNLFTKKDIRKSIMG